MSDGVSFSLLFTTYHNELVAFVSCRTRDVALAEDIVSDSFIKAWRSRHKFDGNYPKAWLYRITKNTLTDHWRKHDSVSLQETSADLLIDDTFDIVDQIDSQLALQKIQNAMLRLPSKLCRVLTLRYFEGMSSSQAASQMQINESSLRVLQHRALARLRHTKEYRALRARRHNSN